MGSSQKRKKPLQVNEVEILDDGSVMITMNAKLYPNEPRIIFTAEALWEIAKEWAEIPRPDETDMPGIPLVDEGDVFEDDDAENEGNEKASEGEREAS